MKPISHCLNKQLTTLCQSAHLLEQLSQQVSQFLPEDLAQHTQVGSFSKGSLTLTTHDANWASQLRFAIPELRDKLRKEAGLYQLSSIKIQVTHPEKFEKIKTSTKPLLSEKTKALILQESHQLQYAPLRQALERLIEG